MATQNAAGPGHHADRRTAGPGARSGSCVGGEHGIHRRRDARDRQQLAAGAAKPPGRTPMPGALTMLVAGAVDVRGIAVARPGPASGTQQVPRPVRHWSTGPPGRPSPRLRRRPRSRRRLARRRKPAPTRAPVVQQQPVVARRRPRFPPPRRSRRPHRHRRSLLHRRAAAQPAPTAHQAAGTPARARPGPAAAATRRRAPAARCHSALAVRVNPGIPRRFPRRCSTRRGGRRPTPAPHSSC